MKMIIIIIIISHYYYNCCYYHDFGFLIGTDILPSKAFLFTWNSVLWENVTTLLVSCYTRILRRDLCFVKCPSVADGDEPEKKNTWSAMHCLRGLSFFVYGLFTVTLWSCRLILTDLKTPRLWSRSLLLLWSHFLYCAWTVTHSTISDCSYWIRLVWKTPNHWIVHFQRHKRHKKRKWDHYNRELHV